MNIGIVGAGVMGRLLALRLSSSNQTVTLFDRSKEGAEGASFVAAGMLSPYCELERSGLLVHELGLKSLELWPDFLKDLEDSNSFQKNHFRKLGSLVVAHPYDLPELERFRGKIISLVGGRTGEGAFHDLSSAEISELEPSLNSHFMNGMFFPFEGHIHPQEFFSATTKVFQQRKIKCMFATEIEKIEFNQISSGSETYRFDWVIDSRGIGARADLRTLRAVRGESILVEAPDINLSRPVRLMHPRYPLYIVPRSRGQFLIGATQIESENKEAISIRSSLELLSAALSIHPGFTEGRIKETFVGLRPTFPNHQPQIKFMNGLKVGLKGGLIRVNGLFRHGYLIGPKIAELITHFILHDEIPDPYSKLFQSEEISHASFS